MKTNMDSLFVGSYFLKKEEQKDVVKKNPKPKPFWKRIIKGLPIEKKKIRNFNIILTIFAGIIAFLTKSKEIYPTIFLGISIYSILSILFYNKLTVPIYIFMNTIGYYIGKVNNIVIVSILYIIFFPIIRLFYMMSKNKQYIKNIDKNLATYWMDYEMPKDDESYKKMY